MIPFYYVDSTIPFNGGVRCDRVLELRMWVVIGWVDGERDGKFNRPLLWRLLIQSLMQ